MQLAENTLVLPAAPPEEPTDASYVLVAGLVTLLVATAVLGWLCWKFRATIGGTLRKYPGWGFALFLLALGCGGASGFLLEGANPSGLFDGVASESELKIYAVLWVMALVCITIACVTGAENFSAASELAELKTAVEREKVRADQAEREAAFAETVNRMFLAVVGKKTERFVNCSDQLRDMNPTTPTFIGQIHQAHQPLQQCVELLAATWSLFELHLIELTGCRKFQLRIALFRLNGDTLEVEMSTNGKRAGVVKGSKRHGCAAHYAIAPLHGQSLAVQAAFSQEILIEPDATVHVDHLKTNYRPHDDSHHRRIRSIVGIPLGLPAEAGNACQRVLCADTNIAGGFLPKHLERLEHIRDNLEQRLLIEIIQTAAFRAPASKRVAKSSHGTAI